MAGRFLFAAFGLFVGFGAAFLVLSGTKHDPPPTKADLQAKVDGDTRPPDKAAPSPPPGVEVAPPPRAVEDTRVYRGSFEGFSHAADTEEVYQLYGVEWRMNVGVRRLASTGGDVIDFKWRMKYTGLRPPLIIRRPSLTDGLQGDTEARIYAFPPGQEKGRMVTFTPLRDDGLTSRVIFDGTPADWWLKVPKGKTATGTETVLVADLKDRLRALYPDEFPADKPPKLYAEFIHNAQDRGRGNFEAWTSDLGTQFKIEVPDLKTW